MWYILLWHLAKLIVSACITVGTNSMDLLFILYNILCAKVKGIQQLWIIVCLTKTQQRVVRSQYT